MDEATPRHRRTVVMINTFHHHRGGDSTYTFGLTRGLEARGHTVVPFAMTHPANLPSPWSAYFAPRVDLSPAPREGGSQGSELGRAASTLALGVTALRHGVWNREAARQLERLLDRVRPDVAHLQHVHHHLTPAVIEPLERRGVPIVWTLHDYELLCPTGHFFRDGAVCEACRVTRFDQAVRHRCERGSYAASALVAVEKAMHRALGVLERLDRFIAPSAFLREKLIEYGVAPERVVHIPNFVEVEEAWSHPVPSDWEHLLSPDRPQARTEPTTRADSQGVYFLFAGRLIPEKGAQVLIDAALEGLPAPVVIAGDGPERAALEARAGSLVGAGRVRFLGGVPHEEMPRWLAGARAVVVPSIWYENCPYAVLEAMAAARPVVASRIGGIPELLEDGVSGLLVQPGSSRALREALRRLHGDPELAMRTAEAGYARALERYSRDVHVARIEQVYVRLRS